MMALIAAAQAVTVPVVMSRQNPIQPGDTVSDFNIVRIVDGLRARTLPKPEWTHGAHLCAGTGLLHEVGLARAEAEMPGIIRRYNAATGVPNTDEEGYHHTITLFYLRAIDGFLSSRWEEPVGACASDVLQSALAHRAFPLRFYSKALLFSVEARRGWSAPELKALPPGDCAAS